MYTISPVTLCIDKRIDKNQFPEVLREGHFKKMGSRIELYRTPQYSCSVQLYHRICRITETSLLFYLIIFYRLKHASSKLKICLT